MRTVGWHEGRVREAKTYLPLAWGRARKGSAEEADLRFVLAGVYDRQGLYAEAAREFRAALDLMQKMVASQALILETRANLSTLLPLVGREDEAETEQRAVLAERIAQLGREHPKTISTRINLGVTLGSLGRFEEAEALQRDAIASVAKVLGTEHPYYGVALANLADALISQKRYAEARDVLLGCVGFWKKRGGPSLATTPSDARRRQSGPRSTHRS